MIYFIPELIDGIEDFPKTISVVRGYKGAFIIDRLIPLQVRDKVFIQEREVICQN